MKPSAIYSLIGIFLGVLFVFTPPPAASQEITDQKLKSMIQELEIKIQDADQRMVAHPTFLEDLRQLVEKYKSQLRELFFTDAFEDGNFNQNPQWVVKSGSFLVNYAGRLTSFVALGGTDTGAGEAKQETSPEAEAVGILLDSLFGGKKSSSGTQNGTQKSVQDVQPAAIYTRTVFPPDFEMTLTFKSSREGEMNIILLGSRDLLPRYRLKIRMNHSSQDPMEIIRISNSRNFVVGASGKFPVINDGQMHTLSWVRTTNGAMTVFIDNDPVLQTYEVYYRDDFTGFEVTNSGGSYEWDSFKIFRAMKP